jgi:tetratricopeptide (TPR) repeat protein/tRNA A-37 threonylcarbamoyl transferase component Bud32
MSIEPESIKELFLAALAVPAAARAAWVRKTCAQNAELRERLEQMLVAHEKPQSLLDELAPATGAPEGTVTDFVAQESVQRAMIAGRYKLLEEIGEGGMGSVWVAEQSQPVRRRVAIKLIKPGMDSRSVLARFEAERQALAMMDQPNIAKVLDGGLTDSGRPYFVMDYVKGVPITEYCDAARLSVEDRLGLFVQICQSVQHAHQKGIIHRDLKPSNILVAPYDGKPVPKVIDFGLAKAIHQPLTDRTLYTAHETVLGTPLYMSPEQAELNNLDVDTRSDVYSLGVLLYELLTGTTPLEGGRFKQAAWEEMKRLIREEEPPKPSTRLSTTELLPTIAASRQIEPGRLPRLIRGDLDWIVMKALEKDRNRRYGSAGAFAEDIERFLRNDAIQARPPSTGYRLRKFARRNRGAVITIGAVTAALFLGLGLTTWQALRATRAERAALAAEAEANGERATAIEQRGVAEKRAAEAAASERQARAAEAAARESDATASAVLNFVKTNIFAAAQPKTTEQGLGKNVTLREALEKAEPQIAATFGNRPKVELELRKILGLTLSKLEDPRRAISQHERALELARSLYGLDSEEVLLLEKWLAIEHFNTGQIADGLGLFEELLARRKKQLGPGSPATLKTIATLSFLYQHASRLEDSKRLAAEYLAATRSSSGKDLKDPDEVEDLAHAFFWTGRGTEGLGVLEHAIPRLAALRGASDPRVLEMTSALAFRYGEAGRTAEAAATLEPAYRRAVAALGPTNEVTLRMLENLSAFYGFLGKCQESAQLLETALPDVEKELGRSHSRYLHFVTNLSFAYASLGRYTDSIRMNDETIKAIPQEHRRRQSLLALYENLSEDLEYAGNPSRAREMRGDWERAVRSLFPAGTLDVAAYLLRIGQSMRNMGQLSESERIMREVVTIRQASEPKGWRVNTARALLGVALFGQGKNTEAEPELTVATRELASRWAEIAPPAKATLSLARRQLALLYARTDRTDKGIQECRYDLAFDEEHSEKTPDSLYNAACWHAVSAAVLDSAKDSSMKSQATTERDDAMALLRRAVVAGYRDFAIMARDPDLDPLRKREDFRKVLADLTPR